MTASPQHARTRHPQPRRLSQFIALLCAGGALSAAQAQEAAAEPVIKIEVTGTLIRGAAPVGAPVTRLDREAIEKSGVASTGELLRLLPQIQNLGADEGHTNAAQNANQNITLGSGINLRGLGPESTLTLVSGQRIAPGGLGAQYTDPSSIPALAIERIEVITDGGSATYGSDAVGGVVNIQLRKRVDGVAVLARHGVADGSKQDQFGIIGGNKWQGGRAMFALEHYRRDNLSADRRGFYTDDLRAWGGPDLRGFNASPGNVQAGAVRYAIPAGQNGVGLARGALVAGNPNLQSIYKGVDALPEQTRNSGVFTLGQEITPGMRLNLDGFLSRREFVRKTAAQSTSATVRSANPFFVSPVAGATSSVVNYSFINDLGISVGNGFEKTSRVSAGLDFDVSDTWSGNAFLARSGTTSRSFSQALNGNAVNAALADTNPATALNLFCDAAKFACNNPATLAKIRAYNDRNSDYRMIDTGVKLDGPLFELPAGTVRIAVGGEVHRDEMAYYENRNNSTPDNNSVFHIDNSAAKPKRTVRSVYAETQVPLVGQAQGVPLVHRIDLSLALRSDDYSDFGRSTNPRVGLDWTVVPGSKVYASFGKAFRAPTLGDLDPVNAGLINVVDRIAADGKTTIHGLVLLGGRDGLQPETASISTLGTALKPAFAPGLSITLDYFNVDYKNRILTPGNDTAIFQKPELVAYLNSAPTAAQVGAELAASTFTGSVSEPASGIKFIQDGRRYNAGVVKTSGVDVATRYDWGTAIGRLNAGLTANYVLSYKQQFTKTTSLIDGLLNTLNNPMRLRARADLGWTGESARANLFANFTNAYTNNTLATLPKVASATTWDMSAQYDVGKLIGGAFKELRASVSVQNLFDRAPPYVQNSTLAFDPQNFSAAGRTVSFSVGTKF
jgi:iron complex outermembrane receptor protein